jgi:hypothetical protein
MNFGVDDSADPQSPYRNLITLNSADWTRLPLRRYNTLGAFFEAGVGAKAV